MRITISRLLIRVLVILIIIMVTLIVVIISNRYKESILLVQEGSYFLNKYSKVFFNNEMLHNDSIPFIL